MRHIDTGQLKCVGVFPSKKRWRALVIINRKKIHLGCYRDWFEAVCARKSAEVVMGLYSDGLVQDLTMDSLRCAVEYNPENGKFVWKARPLNHFAKASDCVSWNKRMAGKELKAVGTGGYRMTAIFGKQYRLHQLAFMYMNGSIPSLIDHINGITTDNSWANLRPADHTINARNMRIFSNNKTGIKGVHRKKIDGKYVAQIRIGGKTKHLGVFDSLAEAANIRAKFEKIHGYSARQ